MKKLTVTIGISAYNEEKNIEKLLRALITQDQISYKLKSIIVASDGSSDKTVKEAKNVKSSIIQISDFKTRQGLAVRLNWMLRKNTSDIFIKMDGDILPFNSRTIENIARKFKPGISLVSGPRIGIGESILEKVHQTGDFIWHTAKKDIKKGKNIHNHHGTISAIGKDLVPLLKVPKGLIGIDDFTYLIALENGKKFSFAPDAIVKYKTPDNLKDYIKQHTRFIYSKKILARHFGRWVIKEYKVPTKNKFTAIIKGFKRSPITTLIYLAISFIVRINLKLNGYKRINYGWESIKSSKGLLSLLFLHLHNLGAH